MEDKFIHLLQSSLWGTVPDATLFSDETDWEGILSLSARHTVQGLVAQAILRLADNQACSLPVGLEEKCLTMMMRNVHANQLVDKVLAEVTKAISVEGFRPVLLKGQGVARYYINPQLRVAGDIDYYVGTGHVFLQVIDCLSRRWPDMNITDKGGKHLNAELNGVEIELHRHAANRDGMRRAHRILHWADNELRCGYNRAHTVGQVVVIVPSPLFDCVFVFIHLFYHFLHEGVGMRQLCDWARCLHENREQLDETKLKDLLQWLGIKKEWQVFGRFLVDHLGLPEEDMPCLKGCEKRARRLLRLILSESNFGKERKAGYFASRPKSQLRHLCRSIVHNAKFWLSRIRLFPRQALPQAAHFFLTGLRKEITNIGH